jgi:hypothetical protein
MQIAAADYPALKAFFAWVSEHLMPPSPGLPPEQRPLAVLEGFEATSMAIARKGLAIAIGDIIEATASLPPGEIAALDAGLRCEGIVTLSEIRARFWTRIRRIMARGSVSGEADYYALRNVVDALPDPERQEGWRILAAHEDKVAGR